MAKLPAQYRFLDVSDYGRSLAKRGVELLLPTSIGAITITWMFTFVGCLAVYFILQQQWIYAAICLPIKSMIDAADGEMARARNKPSYIGRYLDTVNDGLLNMALFVSLAMVTNVSLRSAYIAWACFQIQGTVFNYYYCVLRHACNGDKTSRILEFSMPEPYTYENKYIVWFLHKIYLIMYGVFDSLVWFLDTQAIKHAPFSKYFMTLVSTMGLGFQLLIMAVLLALGYAQMIIWFFTLPWTVLALSIIVLRIVLIRKKINS